MTIFSFKCDTKMDPANHYKTNVETLEGFIDGMSFHDGSFLPPLKKVTVDSDIIQ